MIDKQKCVRCNREFDLFEYFNDAEDYTEELLEEGIVLTEETGYALCDECAMEVVE